MSQTRSGSGMNWKRTNLQNKHLREQKHAVAVGFKKEEIELIPATTVSEWFSKNYTNLKYIFFTSDKRFQIDWYLADDTVMDFYLKYRRNKSILKLDVYQLAELLLITYKYTLRENTIKQPNRNIHHPLFNEKGDFAEDKYVYDDINYAMVDANHELGSNDYNNMCPLQYCADMSNSRKFKKMFKTSKVKSKARDDSYGYKIVRPGFKLVAKSKMSYSDLKELAKIQRIVEYGPNIPLSTTSRLFLGKWYPKAMIDKK